jgi:hypothetical protein|tara:strand:- start:321 stop:536 length:216 start_codon:yes stop_codon:yes gene_type:complete
METKMSAITKHTLPHGFTIEQNKFYQVQWSQEQDKLYEASWSLLCNGSFVFHGSEDECFTAFGSHLQGINR